MAYHCTASTEGCDVVCGCAILPLRTKAKGPAPPSSSLDVVDEAISYFRANVLFREFEVRGPADKLLVYLTLFIGACLQRLTSGRLDEQQAHSALFQYAHEAFEVPGDAKFALGGFMSPPANKEEADLIRGYLEQCREEVAKRLVDCCYREGKLNKFWTAFANRKFMNKSL